jgi:L-cysteine:1D-myo-inositol 2-amino-2-deoxy-alpha-D-glucopyranoside ligase
LALDLLIYLRRNTRTARISNTIGGIVKLYNTFSEQIEPFGPYKRGVVTIYVCGITPYDTTHLGHAFTYATADILIRYLEWQGLKVRYVQNVTDIDDDILKRAGQVGEDWIELGRRWTNHFIQDMQSLNVRPPDFYPHATDVIPEIITFVENLLMAGVAYQGDGSVYYSVNSWKSYGALCHLGHDEMLPIANERGNRPNDPHKKDPLDFVLWQAQAPGEPAWDSPWGPGRPGWHIECSTMARMLLGDVVDIHGGGGDLCFPHHESEIAQVLPVTKEDTYVRYWFHTAMLRYQGEKMSKSLGNLVMVRDLLKTYTPDDIRLCLARHHYRDSWSYTEDEMRKSAETVNDLLAAVQVPSGNGKPLDVSQMIADFKACLDEDLDSPSAVSVLKEIAAQVKNAAGAGLNVLHAQDELRACAAVLGLRLDQEEPEQRVVEGWQEHIR